MRLIEAGQEGIMVGRLFISDVTDLVPKVNQNLGDQFHGMVVGVHVDGLDDNNNNNNNSAFLL